VNRDNKLDVGKLPKTTLQVHNSISEGQMHVTTLCHCKSRDWSSQNSYFFLAPDPKRCQITLHSNKKCARYLLWINFASRQTSPKFMLDRVGKNHYLKLECRPMPNVMVALLNIGGALCWMPQFGWRPLLECRAVTLPIRETRWNWLECPKLTKRSQPLVGRSSPYCEDM